MSPSQETLEVVAKEWETHDEEAHAKRVALLQKMSDLRTINESMAEWTQDCKREWDILNKEEEQAHKARMDWNRSNTGVASSYVPTMKTFHSHSKVGVNPSNQAPHWFDTVCISSQASKLAWDAVKSGQCSTDLSTSGGKAVDSLYCMLSDAQKHWKPTTAASKTSKIESTFDWNSHDYDIKRQKTSVEAKLFAQPTGKVNTLPREYQNDIQFYIRQASNPTVTNSNNEADPVEDDPATSISNSISDKLSKISLTPLTPLTPLASTKPTTSKMGVANAAGSSWWSASHWSAP